MSAGDSWESRRGAAGPSCVKRTILSGEEVCNDSTTRVYIFLANSIEETIHAVRSNLGCLYRNNPIVLGDFEHLIQVWKQENPRNVNFRKIMAALDFAAVKHVAQVRNHADWVPYIVHPLRVVLLLWEEAGFRKTDLLAAAFLHEILDDTKTVPAEIAAAFGCEVLELVEQLTLRPELGLSDQAEKMSREAKAIKLADRTHNLRDLLDHPPKVWQSGKVAAFIQKSQELLHALEGVNLKLESAYMAALDNLIHTNTI